MKKLSAPLLVLSLAFFVGCVNEVEDDDYDVEGIQDEIEATNARFESHVAAQQWDSVSALYTDDAIMMPQGAPMQRGINAIRQGFVQMGQQGGVSNIRLETVEVEASGDLAYEVGQYTVEGQAGAQLDRGKYLVVWKRDGDTWRIHRDILNSDSMTQGLPMDTTGMDMMPGQTPGTRPGETQGLTPGATSPPVEGDTAATIPDDTTTVP